MTASALRVPRSTPEPIQQRIRRETREHAQAAVAKGPDAVGRRVRELDAEWDTERVLETVSSSLVLAGLALGLTVHRRFLLLPAVVAGFLLEHALQGWCPPLPIIRSLGVRTRREIDDERTALLAVRGDFVVAPQEGAAATLDRLDRLAD